MPPSPDKADAPLRWIDNARADLALASIPLPPGVTYEQLSFHAQQAAEKALKAVLLKCRVDFPFIHNLQALIDLLPSELFLPPELVCAVDLNPYAVTTRYPGEAEPVTEDEYREALRAAELVLVWAESVICS